MQQYKVFSPKVDVNGETILSVSDVNIIQNDSSPYCVKVDNSYTFLIKHWWKNEEY